MRFIRWCSGPVDRYTLAIALTGTFYALAFLTTFIRLYHRVQIRKFWWDDFWAAFGLISGILTCVLWLGVQKIMSQFARPNGTNSGEETDIVHQILSSPLRPDTLA